MQYIARDAHEHADIFTFYNWIIVFETKTSRPKGNDRSPE